MALVIKEYRVAIKSYTRNQSWSAHKFDFKRQQKGRGKETKIPYFMQLHETILIWRSFTSKYTKGYFHSPSTKKIIILENYITFTYNYIQTIIIQQNKNKITSVDI